MKALRGADFGKQFEEIFEIVARISGLLPIKNHLKAKVGWKGEIRLLKSNLDFMLISQSGQVGFFDCKTFADDHFSYSQIDQAQIDTAVLYNYWNVPAGFVVWFRPTNQVCYFKGSAINKKGPGSSFNEKDGLVLGRPEELRLGPIMRLRG